MADKQFQLGGQPITVARIRDHQRVFKGAPSGRVPFSGHAVRYLLHLLDAIAREQGETLESLEHAHGNTDPPNAHWILNPRQEGTWQTRMKAYFASRDQQTGAAAIPYAGGRVDLGTEACPEWDRYEEARHEDARQPVAPEVQAEQQARAAEPQHVAPEGHDIWVVPEADDPVEPEQTTPTTGGMSELF